MALDSQEFNIQLLESIISPSVPCTEKCLKNKSAPTKIKSLYHLFQLSKNINSGKWTGIYQGKTRIAKDARISKKAFCEFINKDFKLFGRVIHRPGTTNVYRLDDWVIELFGFLERIGMMKNFRKNFSDWKKKFKTRLCKWLLPLLRKGVTLSQILMNKISTKKDLKGGDLNPVKGGGIKPSGSHEAFQGFRSKPEHPIVPVVNDFVEISRLLSSRFLLKEGDINQLMRDFSLSHHKKAVLFGERWLKNGLKSRSPVKIYQCCLNKTKRKLYA